VGTSAFIVKVPEAERCVQGLRLLYDETARLGVPAHITLLVPFMDASLISGDVVKRAADAIRSVPSFNFRLSGVGRFPNVAYLAPEPSAPFIALTHALVSAFPGYPPYGGQHSAIVPHLSVAIGHQAPADHASSALSAWLKENGPIDSACTSVALLENSTGYWKEMHGFGLANAEG
jgi:2'-5' RNA ligase